MASDVEVRQAIRRSLQVASAAIQQGGHHIWRAAWTSERAEFVAVKRGCEVRYPAAQYSTHGNQLQRNGPIEHGRPVNAHLHQGSYCDWMIGGHENSSTAHIDSQSGAGERGAGRRGLEANSQIEWIAEP